MNPGAVIALWNQGLCGRRIIIKISIAHISSPKQAGNAWHRLSVPISRSERLSEKALKERARIAVMIVCKAGV